MNERTFNPDNLNNEQEFNRATNIRANNARIIVRNAPSGVKKTLLKGGIAAVLGLAGGAVALSLMSFTERASEVVPPKIDSFEGFDILENEDANSAMQRDPISLDDISEELPEDEHPLLNTENAVVIYANAPFATCVTDEMSYNDAFQAARAELGPGGFFEWKGNTYGTFYKDEWDSLTDDQKNDFWESVHENTTLIQEDNISETPTAEIIEANDLSDVPLDLTEEASGDNNNTPENNLSDRDNFTITEEDIIEANDNDIENNETSEVVFDLTGEGKTDFIALSIDETSGANAGDVFATDIIVEEDMINDFDESSEEIDINQIIDNDNSSENNYETDNLQNSGLSDDFTDNQNSDFNHEMSADNSINTDLD